MNHSEECRKRLAEELEKIGDERLVCETERMFEHSEKEENNKKRAERVKTMERVDRVHRPAGRQWCKKQYQEAGEEFRWRWTLEIVCRRL